MARYQTRGRRASRTRRWLVEVRLARGALGRYAGCPAMGVGCALRLGKCAAGRDGMVAG